MDITIIYIYVYTHLIFWYVDLEEMGGVMCGEFYQFAGLLLLFTWCNQGDYLYTYLVLCLSTHSTDHLSVCPSIHLSIHPFMENILKCKRNLFCKM